MRSCWARPTGACAASSRRFPPSAASSRAAPHSAGEHGHLVEETFADDDRAQLRGEPPRRQAIVSADPAVPASYRARDAIDFYLQPVPEGAWENNVTVRSTRAARMYEPGHRRTASTTRWSTSWRRPSRAIASSDARAVLVRSEGENFSFGGDIMRWPGASRPRAATRASSTTCRSSTASSACPCRSSPRCRACASAAASSWRCAPT